MADNKNPEVKRGMTISNTLATASKETGIQVNRNPHATGTVAASGTGRAETHDTGNRQAINQVKQKIVQKKEDPTYFQASQVRSREKQQLSPMPKVERKSEDSAKKNLQKMYRSQTKRKEKTKDFDPWSGGNPNR